MNAVYNVASVEETWAVARQFAADRLHPEKSITGCAYHSILDRNGVYVASGCIQIIAKRSGVSI